MEERDPRRLTGATPEQWDAYAAEWQRRDGVEWMVLREAREQADAEPVEPTLDDAP